MDGEDSQKKHHKSQAGPKAKKKKAKSKHEQELTPQQKNPKAFAIQHVRKTAKIVQRSQDIKTKKQHIPLVDRTPLEPPPVVIAIVGPPKVGKTTLLQCLVKNYTRQRLSRIQGPVTLVSGKHRRLTLMECNNDVNSMIDIAKVADLVLLLVDASFGFEMETFEFLNICQVHGFPRIMGVLTHLDAFKDNKQMRKTKKRLKNRFWTEVYQGAKLFYLSGMVNGEYQKTEVHNLCRFISVMKFRPLQWRITHPYVLVDRMEDISDPEKIRVQPKCDRKVCLYGYVRGTHMKNHINVHIPGCGDYSVQDMHFLPDPCPLPGQEKKRSLSQKDKLIYAPMSGVGGIIYDKDAVYIDLGGSHSHREKEEESKPVNELVASLMSVSNTLNEKISSSHMTLFSNTAPLSDAAIQENSEQDDRIQSIDEPVRRQALFDDDCTTTSSKKKDQKSHFVFADSDEDGDESHFQLFSATSQQTKKPLDKTEKQMIDHLQESDKHKSIDCDDDDEDEDEDDDDDEEDDEEDEDATSSKDKTLSKEKSDVSLGMKDDNEMRDDDGENEDDISDSSQSESGSDDSAELTQVHIDETANKKQKLENGQVLMKTHQRPKQAELKSNSGDEDEDDDEQDDSSDEENSDDNSDIEESDDESNVEENDDDDDENENDDKIDDLDRNERLQGAKEGSDNEMDEEEGFIKWKSNLAAVAAESFKQRQSERINYRKLIYGKGDDEELKEENDEEDELAGLFTVLKKKSEKSRTGKTASNRTDCSKFAVEKIQNWELEEVQDLIRDCFVTGQWDKSEDAATRLKEDDEIFGDFEDLETGEIHTGLNSDDDSDDGMDDDKDEDEASEGKDEVKPEERKKTKAEMTAYEKRVEKKRKLKEMFDTEYDMKGDTEYYDQWKLELEQQAKLNRAEFENLEDDVRVGYEGFRPGMYVRVEIDNVPCEFVNNFNPTYPVILGGLLNIENNIGYVQVRLKKHRWYKKILKTRNPLIISLGWRRFQTIPLYSIQDHNKRNRLLKYTPEHMHCHSSFWGPITPQGTGLLAVESVDAATATPGFRIAATGVVLELDKSMQIVKKLKLTGTPSKIFRKTAFIQGMFNSILEVTKFEGAKIRTVSGIRGQVKKGLRTPEGAFRATFEDKILMSDIVFMRTWFPVEVPQFYATVTSLLLPNDQKVSWRGMRTLGQLRKDKNVPVPQKQDSFYKPVERKKRFETTLRIPRDLQKELPFKDTPKILQQKKDPIKRIAVVMEPQEAKVSKLMKMLKTLHEHKRRTEHVKMRHRAAQHQKEMDRIGVKKAKKQKEVKKEIFRVLGQIEKKKNKYRQ